MRIFKLLTLVVGLALAVTGPAAGVKDKNKDKPRNHGRGENLTQMRFAGLDTNHDGRITRDEWRGNDVSFNQHDWNGDGVLSGAEVTPGAESPGRDDDDNFDRFDRLDVNHDGRLSVSEWPGDRVTFDRLDLNRDGFLTRDELRQQFDDRLDRAFRNLDTNADGRVSRAEWRGDLTQFDRLDRNRDGFLSLDEFMRR